MDHQLKLKLLGIVFAFISLTLLGRLFYWQVIKRGYLMAFGRSQHARGQQMLARRGSILDINESPLATSVDSWLIYAERPQIIDSYKSVANKLAPFFVEDEDDKNALLDEAMRLEGLLDNKDLVWVPLQKKVDNDTKKNIEALSIKGIGFELHDARYYPEASSSAHILGFVGKDDQGTDIGYFGLEGFYDLTLAGKPGFLERDANALGAPILSGSSKESDSLRGVDLVTYLDKTLQLKVEENLQEGMEKYGAISGIVIIMDPQTGGVMALASHPSYDPLNYFNFSDTVFRNPAISDSFEPGSVFKPLVMAAALDAGVVEPDTKCDICGEPYKVDKYFIKTWNNKYADDSTMTDVIVHSDNVGMAFVGNKLGADKLYDYLDRFGIGRLTEIDLQGEATPSMREKGTWNIVDQATTSFGQGIATTPIQMIKAITVIARGGEAITPRVVKSLKIDNWQDEFKLQADGRVISQKAANEITEMMIKAVESGEAKWAVPDGFKIAGKTGTAQIPVSGHYDEEKTIASFVGFAPADDPKMVMLVTLREPQSSPWASETAAPLWFNIALDIFPHLGIYPNN